MKTFWFDEPVGIKIYNTVGKMYHKIYGFYPMVLTELPTYLNSIGYPVAPVNIKPPFVGKERKGFTTDDETAVALLLRFA